MDFFNRAEELQALQERWASPRGEYFILYGRRRIGKSHLLLRFGEGRHQLYFEASEGSRQDHLDDLSGQLAALTGRALYAEQSLNSWRAAFAAFDELLAQKPTMIVLDEFQFIARREPEIGSLLNRFIARHQDNPGLLLCIAGSDVSFFEKDVMAYGATSYGRRTGSLQLQPFAWDGIGPFVRGWSVADQIRAWSVFGGVPYYLQAIDPGRPLTETLLRAVLYPDGLLRNEPRFLLSQESRIRNIDHHMSALRAIATGSNRLNEIAQRIGKRSAEEARPFLETLEEMELIERIYPVTQPASKKVLYGIRDPFLRFWFRFVSPRESRLHTRRDAEAHLEQSVRDQLDKFVSEDAFERVCRQWLFDREPKLADAGRWWGSIRSREAGQARSQRYEADVAGIDSSGTVVALGSCKWADPSTPAHAHSAAELDKLETIRAEIGAPEADLYFFDRVAFSPRLQEIAGSRPDVHLVAVEELR